MPLPLNNESRLSSANFALLISSHGLKVFILLLLFTTLRHYRRLFLQTHGRSHRITGLILLLHLSIGAFFFTSPRNNNENNDYDDDDDDDDDDDSRRCNYLIYDVILGILGIVTTITAIHDFPHKHVRNAVGESGTLSRRAIVTQSEMKEHVFYQILNLVQALYLHSLSRWGDDDDDGDAGVVGLVRKLFLLWFVTSPWHFRSLFPVNSFSANWSHGGEIRKETILYRIKKWQYIFYKHVVLHGLNISLIVTSSNKNNNNNNDDTSTNDLVSSRSWRIFWICLNGSYVLEFFLQSLVKRNMLTQEQMMRLQRFLMVVSSVAAIDAVFKVVIPGVAMVSVFLNFVNRGNDVGNTMMIGCVSLALMNNLIS